MTARLVTLCNNDFSEVLLPAHRGAWAPADVSRSRMTRVMGYHKRSRRREVKHHCNLQTLTSQQDCSSYTPDVVMMNKMKGCMLGQ